MSVVLATADQNGVLLEVRHGDICSEQVSAIVNPANEAMRHRGGVAKVIADKAGGGIVQRESDEWISRNLTLGGQARYQIFLFQNRPIINHLNFGDAVLYDTYDYGFATLLPVGQIEVQEYNGTAKLERRARSEGG